MDKEKLGNFGLCAVVIVVIVILSAMRMDVREKLSVIPSSDGESVLSSSDTMEIKLDTKDLGDLKIEHVAYGAGRIRIAVYDTKKIFPNFPEGVNIYMGEELKEYSFFKNTIYGKEYLNFILEGVDTDDKLKVEFRGKTAVQL